MRPAKESGSAQGMSSDRRIGHCMEKGRLASSASPRPMNSAPGTVISVIRTVFQVVSQKIGSSNIAV
ncbi:hypothetical protein D3C78_1579160 [compost metagenome]